MKNFKLMGVALAALLSVSTLTSCLDSNKNDSPNTFTATMPATMSLTAVKDLATSSWTTYPGGSVRFQYDLENSTLQLTVQSMKVSATDGLTFLLPVMPVSTIQGAWTTSQTGPFVVSGAGQTHSISNVRTALRLPENAPSIVKVEFDVDEKYHVVVYPVLNYFSGTTRVVTKADGEQYMTERTYYNLTLDQATSKAELFIYRPKFAANMPDLECLSFAGVPFTVGDNGISFESASLIPNTVTFDPNSGQISKRTEQPRFAITDFAGTMQVAEGINFKFTCANTWDVTFSGTPLTKVPE